FTWEPLSVNFRCTDSVLEEWSSCKSNLTPYLLCPHDNKMSCFYLIRGIQSSLKHQPVITQSRHVCHVGSLSNINCINATPVGRIKSPCVESFLKKQGNVPDVTKRPLFYNCSVQPSPSRTAVRWFCSSSSSTSDEGKLIYSGSLAKAVLGVKFFSYSTSIFSICVMPQIVFKTGIGVESLGLQVLFCGVIGIFTFLTPVLLHLVTKGYVVRLYHNAETDTYTAVTYSALLAEKKTVFHQREVSVPDVSGMFTSFYANRRSMLVNPMLFSVPQDYNHLMGYDKPFSFDMDALEKPERGKRD
ncbi:hypothetical protein GJAV_G00091760, partial [Gymnothorax javanicus]